MYPMPRQDMTVVDSKTALKGVHRSCTQCGEMFESAVSDLAFYDRISPAFAGRKFTVPPPMMCPDCRFQRRLMFRNDRHFYRRKSDKSGKEIITIYSPEKPYVVYDRDEWWGDDWDPRDYGREIDFSRPFFEQYQELRLSTPRANLFTSNIENSEYTNHALNMRNCYLIWGGGDDEDCLYGNYIAFCKDTVDGLSLYRCERCYEGIASERCYGCIDFHNCRDCKECIAIEECSSCEYCIGCHGLQRKKYCVFNEQLTREEWERRRKELGTLTQEKIALLRGQLHSLKKNLPHRGSHIFASENCTGDNIYNSRNCRYCFDITDSEDCTFVAFTPKGKDVYDATFTAPDGLELCYYVGSSLGGQRMLWTFLAYYCSDTYYSMECHNCQHLFGCSSMRRNEYCIFNKQYSKDDYEVMVAKLIDHMRETGEWGDYFPPSLAPIAYNESNAHDYFPLTKDAVEERGWWWREEEERKERGELLEKVPETIEEVDDSICDKVLTCEVTGKQFKILPQELRVYRKMGVPVPRQHPHARHHRRMILRCPRRLWERTCAKCGGGMMSNCALGRSEIVWCENCYLREVY